MAARQFGLGGPAFEGAALDDGFTPRQQNARARKEDRQARIANRAEPRFAQMMQNVVPQGSVTTPFNPFQSNTFIPPRQDPYQMQAAAGMYGSDAYQNVGMAQAMARLAGTRDTNVANFLSTAIQQPWNAQNVQTNAMSNALQASYAPQASLYALPWQQDMNNTNALSGAYQAFYPAQAGQTAAGYGAWANAQGAQVGAASQMAMMDMRERARAERMAAAMGWSLPMMQQLMQPRQPMNINTGSGGGVQFS